MKKTIALCDICEEEVKSSFYEQFIVPNFLGNIGFDICEDCGKKIQKVQLTNVIDENAAEIREIFKECYINLMKINN